MHRPNRFGAGHLASGCGIHRTTVAAIVLLVIKIRGNGRYGWRKCKIGD